MHANRAFSLRLLSTTVVVGLLLLVSASVASAHERREVGEYTFVVGFRAEPALVDEPNGLDLRVSRGAGDAAEPVEGLHETLQAEIIHGGATMPLELRGVFNTPGRYTADVIPTATGTYSFRIFGTIDGAQVDETFTGGPDTFAEVQGKDAISFPSGVAGGETGNVADAQDAADSAQMLGIIALIVGLVGLGAGVAALAMARGGQQGTVRAEQPDTGAAGD
ncbi:MAG TPA: hypothetical protein VMM78_05505 [Thermomicrobiales bacterium]|nr:hypothetical protein [Thermomicrobiales bacterium]